MSSAPRNRSKRPLGGFELLEPRIVLSADAASSLTALGSFGGSFFFGDPHEQTGLNEARDEYGFTGEGQTVVIIDSGVAYDHVALDDQYVGGYDFVENDANPYDDGPYGSHGTHVAGILAGDDGAFQGVAPGVDIVALRVFGDTGQSDIRLVEDALQWVLANIDTFENPITTINVSLGLNATAAESAILNDELAQLAAENIFIAAAAGNSFAVTQNTTLSYPASSPYVTPVASIDPSGALSFFSQRNDRVIAAPGRSIESTVPDYLGDGNGVADDYGRYSGTSMASPYVAGAAVLVREAMMEAGWTSITSESIYDVLYDSADLVRDSITGASYHSLNIAEAIAAVFAVEVTPVADDFGSTATDAEHMGAVDAEFSIGGQWETATDRDYFQYTAQTDGTFTVAMTGGGRWDASTIVGSQTNTNGILTFTATAGQTFTFGVVASNVGAYTITGDLTPPAPAEPPAPSTPTSPLPEDLPDAIEVDLESIDSVRLGQDGAWLAFEATSTGWMTIIAASSRDLSLEAFDADGQTLSDIDVSDADGRIDVNVAAGEVIYVHVTTDTAARNASADLMVANLVSLDDGRLTVRGTNGGDNVSLAMGDQYALSIAGIDYALSPSLVHSIEIDGRGGVDTITLTGSSAADQAIVRPGRATIVSANYDVQADGFEIVAIASGGGNDTVTIHDTSGADKLKTGPRSAELVGSNYHVTATGFQTTWTIASAGGVDTVEFLDSTGDDTFNVSATAAILSGDGYTARADGFDTISIDGKHGGRDRAVIEGTDKSELLLATPNFTRFYGPSFNVWINAFDSVTTKAGGGHDRAFMLDSSGDDVVIATPTSTRLQGSSFVIEAQDFESTLVHAIYGGFDRAYVQDSDGDDQLTVRGAAIQLADEAHATTLYGFDSLYARSGAGGDDKAEIDAVDMAVYLLGDWNDE